MRQERAGQLAELLNMSLKWRRIVGRAIGGPAVQFTASSLFPSVRVCRHDPEGRRC